MLAVAFTIRNRVRAGWHGGDWITVLSEHKTWSASLEPYPEKYPDPRDPNFLRLLQSIDGIFSGATDDTITVSRDTIRTTAAPVVLYYGRLDIVDNDWFLEEICRSPLHERLATVGNLTFFS